MSYSSRTTPRSSASQGRIVTENTALSAILRENSKGNLAPAPLTVSVDSPALDVVSSDVDVVNVSNASSNIDCKQNVQHVSNSETSLKNATDVEHQLSPEHKLVSPAENISDTYNHPVVESERPDKVHTPHNSTPSNTYAYRSLKSTYQTDQVSRVPSKSSFAHDIDVSEKLHVTDNQLTNVRNDSVVVIGSGNTNDNSHVHSSENKETLGRKPEHLAQENSSRQNTRHTIKHSRGHSIVSPQNTRLSLYSQHERVDRGRTPLRVNTQDQIVPPLDLSDLDKPVSDNCDNSPNSVDKLEHLTLEDQKLHASDQHTSVSYFSPGVYNPTNRTYGVETPVHASELPVINSYENFRQDDDQDTFRDRQQGPDALEEHRSDLADDLRVPYPFDTQAGNGSLNAQEPKPPSPPVQTTPPPSKEPATSLHSGNNVYAVANPDILRAQGIEPPADNHWTPRQHSNTPRRPSQGEVRFDKSSEQNKGGEAYGGSPVKDRVPTPYAKSPGREELPRSPADWDVPIEENSREQSNTSKQGLPPQHPPLDTLHSSKPGSRSSKKVDDNQSVKRVYVESPSFTKEEEEEYRFVSSRLEDIDDKNQATFRAMDNRGYGGDDRPGNDYSLRDSRGRKNDSEYDRRTNEKDRYDRDRYSERNDNRDTDMNRYEDRTREMNGYQNEYNRDRDRNRDHRHESERDNRHDDDYGDRYGGNDRYARGGSEKYSNSNQDRGRDSYGRQDRYENLRNERDNYEREPRREDEPNFRQGYGKQYTELDEVDLQKEAEYQKDLKRRIDKQGRKIKDSEKYEPKYSRDSYNKENDFARDSLEYPDERDMGQERDSYHHNPQGPQIREWDNPVQSQDWDNPPQNPYQDNGGYYGNQGFSKQDSRPDFYDPEDVEKMELVNPKAPRYDYVEKNKQDYGMNAKKSYQDIVHKKKEEEEKLDHIFITPKVPSKKKHKKAQSAQPEHMGHQPPPQYPVGFKPSSAEELWAQKARVLQHKKGSASSGKQAKASASKSMPRWNMNNSVKPAMRYENPAPMPNQGQLYKPGNAYQPKEQGGYSQQQGGYSQNQQERYSPYQQSGYTQSQGGYGTPTRQLQPLENRPAPPVATEMVPTAVQPSSPYRRHMELKPISQEITTEDGQRISVDINLRLISPPPGQSGPGSPTQTQQLALLPVQETQGPSDQRTLGVPYQMQDTQAGNYDGYNTGYEVSHFSDIN